MTDGSIYFVRGNLRYLQNEYVVVTFDKFWVDHFLPPVLALDVSPVRKMVGYKVPSFPMDFHQPFKFFILKFGIELITKIFDPLYKR